MSILPGQLNFFSPLDTRRFPLAQDLVEHCRKYKSVLFEDFNVAYEMGAAKPWPEKINKGGWEVAGVKWQGKMLEGSNELMPNLYELVSMFDKAIVNAGFSVLFPNASIAPHRGYTAEVLRLHFPLYLPKGPGSLGIKIDGVQYTWVDDSPLFFDDTLEHEAWNMTNDVRVVVLFDLLKDCL